jgi:hypothetical protein
MRCVARCRLPLLWNGEPPRGEVLLKVRKQSLGRTFRCAITNADAISGAAIVTAYVLG